jgi:hypothetical protein
MEAWALASPPNATFVVRWLRELRTIFHDQNRSRD